MKIELLKVNDLKPWQDNPRVIPDNAIDKVVQSIKFHGFNQPLVVNQEKTVCVGHTRLLAARKIGLIEVPCLVKKMTDEEFKAYAIADNKSNEFSDWDFGKLHDIFENWSSDITPTLFDKSDFGDLFDNIETDLNETPIDKTDLNKQSKTIILIYKDNQIGEFIELVEFAEKKLQTKNVSDTLFKVLQQWFNHK